MYSPWLCYYTNSLLPVAAEVLAQELAIICPGIQIITAQPGFFKTRVFAKLQKVKPSLPEYADLNAMVTKAEEGFTTNSPGDPDKGVAAMIDLVKGTGLAAGKAIPVRVPLGSDSWAAIKKECEDMLAICAEWEEFAKSVDLVKE